MRRSLTTTLCAMVLLAANSAQAASPPESDLAVVRALLAMPESGIDLAKAKIAIDRIIDPSQDERIVLRDVDKLSSTISLRIPPRAWQRQKLEILVDSLRTPGPWNDGRAFRYDLKDPFGKNLKNKLLSTYLVSRRGNCVSMPILFAALAQRIGLKVALARAPEHVLVKFKDDSGKWINIETTTFGTKSDASYRIEMDIAPQAIEQRVYLAPLTRRQSLSILVETLLEHYASKGLHRERIAVADALIALNPKDVTAWLHAGSAHARILKSEYVTKYPSSQAMPEAVRLQFESHAMRNRDAYARAEALGWREPSAEQDAAYMRRVEQARRQQGESK